MAAASKSRAIAALGALSLLWASRVLWPVLLPTSTAGVLPNMERQALPFVLLTILACSFAVARRQQWPRGQSLWNAVLVGLGLFIVPAGLISYADASMPAQARTALLTLTPVFAFVFEPYIGGDEARPSANRNYLVAALAAVAGALCVFPIGIPRSIEAGAAFCALIAAAACIAAANCLAVALLHQDMDSSSAIPLTAISSATVAITLTAGSVCFERPVLTLQAFAPQLLWSATIELPALLLLFWLMRHMSATRMATRYLWAPLIAVTLAAAMLRAVLAWRTWLGLLLMAAGASYLLLASETETESNSLSLH
jgi:drug/metabolite transporter (DMT)-like permease